MLIFYDNKIDASGVTFTASSAVSTLPAANVANEFRERVWRTGTSTAAETLVMDLGSAQAITSIIILDHTLTASDSLIKIQGNAADSWGAPSFNQALTWASGTIGLTFASQSYRYWRFIFTKSAAGESRDVGRIFLGTYYSTTEQPDFDGYDEDFEDLSKKSKSLGGQTYTEQLSRYSILKLKFSSCPNTQMGNFKTIFETVGTAVSFFVQVDTVSPLDKFYYVKFRKALGRQVDGNDGDVTWQTTLELEEQL